MKKQTITTPEGYNSLLKDIKSILQKGLTKAYKAVDNIKVQTYWQIGERILREELQHKERADYGKQIIDNLAEDLGFRRDELYRIVQFYNAYPIVVTVSQQLSWSHYIELIKLKTEEERKFYEAQSIIEKWSVRELRKRVEDNEYRKIKKTGKVMIKPLLHLPSPEEVFKDTYNFNFLELKKDYSENDLKSQLLLKFERTLQEFGSNFFIGEREKKIIIDGTIHKIDLVLFHKLIMCTILADFKIGKFKAEYILLALADWQAV